VHKPTGKVAQSDTWLGFISSPVQTTKEAAKADTYCIKVNAAVTGTESAPVYTAASKAKKFSAKAAANAPKTSIYSAAKGELKLKKGWSYTIDDGEVQNTGESGVTLSGDTLPAGTYIIWSASQPRKVGSQKVPITVTGTN
jgi:hypothetical protein